jgi:ribonuclease HI
VSRKGKEHSSRSDNKGEMRSIEKWKPPPEGWTKINMDGSFVEHTGQAGIGLIARNHLGEVIFTAWKALSRCVSAAEAEAMACAEGAQLAAQWVQGPVIFETDCARVCNAMSSKEDRSDISFVILEAKEHAQAVVEWRVS